ncbi:EutN/CcmL family microcompartment protein [Desulforamulus aeronauticus]|uniref:Ethanolamine utilization protein EutN n=1 Tax=Desulforamulus aeronauticus DSM 10349 TaxID=1121421 RepID=A0A1M6WAV3_9FIRM|nr:EutN/CcmL family microcompartment protein [Desulforamulus aeronauticus]SHK90871.1 ethanolamine utilization protein EutN [Desulforamulus aeronauticus DSM 10349]
MIAVKVIDNIWSTRKAESLIGLKFMLVEVLGGIDAGRLMIAADTIGAGIGERVIVCTGSSARKMLDRDDVPVDAVIVGIIDEDCVF